MATTAPHASASSNAPPLSSNSTPASASKSKNIVFIHPDLGIGGAERLILDAALCLQAGAAHPDYPRKHKHTITIYTSHLDPHHCFPEATSGILDVRVRGATLLPPFVSSLSAHLPAFIPAFLTSLTTKRFTIIRAILHQLLLILSIAVFSSELADLAPDVFVVDQLSAGVPLLKALARGKARVLFYCHFPDLLLVRGRGGVAGAAGVGAGDGAGGVGTAGAGKGMAGGGGLKTWIKTLYRIPFDALEGWSMGFADVVVVNSLFTRGVVARQWPRLGKGRELEVVYPCVDVKEKKKKQRQQVEKGEKGGREEGEGDDESLVWRDRDVLLSINRFEKKKDVGLAIRAYAGLGEHGRKGVRLVVAGGYDNRVQENVTYHKELTQLADALGLKSTTTKNVVTALGVPDDIDVLFLLSVPNSLKDALLKSARLLVYTPSNEHFGIVPLEAMLAGTPVLAANTGGPLETVVDGVTGWLCPPGDVRAWTAVMDNVLHHMSDAQLQKMAEAGRQRVVSEFSDVKMAERLENIIDKMTSEPGSSSSGLALVLALVSIIPLVGMLATVSLWKLYNS